MKQINSLKHAAAGLTSLAALLVLTLALALPLLVSSCQAEDDPAGGPDGFTVEITTLSGVAIEPMDGAATAQQQNYPNSPSKLEGVPEGRRSWKYSPLQSHYQPFKTLTI